MNNNDINKQKGIILPVVLIFFSFLMLLGVTFVSVGGFQVSQSMGQVNRSQAYYLAKSGAESFADHLYQFTKDNNYNESVELIDKISNNTSDVVGIFNGEIEIDVEEVSLTDTISSLKITSTSIYMSEKAAVTINLILNHSLGTVESGFSELLGTTLILTNGNSKSSLHGSTMFDGDLLIPHNSEFTDLVTLPSGDSIEEHVTGEITKADADFTIPEVVFPQFPNLINKGSINLNKSQILTIFEDAYYEQITLSNDSVLYIDISKVKQLRIGQISLNNFSKIELINNSESDLLEIFLDGGLNLTNETTFNYDGNPRSIQIYSQNSNLNMSVKSKLHANILIEKGQVNLTNNILFKGSLVSNNNIQFNLSSFAQLEGMIYLPKSHLNSSNKVKIYGNVVVDSLQMQSDNSDKNGVSGIFQKDISDIISDELLVGGSTTPELTIEFNDNRWNR